MKITPEHAQIIREYHTKGSALLPLLSEYIAAGMTKRRRDWDALHAAKFWGAPVAREVYRYANDDHIDTVLRNIE